jgi:hypothetical protein
MIEVLIGPVENIVLLPLCTLVLLVLDLNWWVQECLDQQIFRESFLLFSHEALQPSLCKVQQPHSTLPRVLQGLIFLHFQSTVQLVLVVAPAQLLRLRK